MAKNSKVGRVLGDPGTVSIIDAAARELPGYGYRRLAFHLRANGYVWATNWVIREYFKRVQACGGTD